MKQMWTCDNCGKTFSDKQECLKHERECIAFCNAAFKIKELLREIGNLIEEHKIPYIVFDTNDSYQEDPKKQYKFSALYPTLDFDFDAKTRCITKVRAKG